MGDREDIAILSKVPEEELVAAFQGATTLSPDEAFDELVRRFREKVFGLSFSYLRNRSEAEDITQEIFIRAFRGLAGFEGRSKFSTWLYRIATNACLNRLRDRKRHPPSLPLEETFVAAPRTRQVDPKHDRLTSELSAVLNRAIEGLPERQQETFRLRYICKLSVRDTAATMSVEEGTVKAHYFAALRHIRALLEKELGREKLFYLLDKD